MKRLQFLALFAVSILVTGIFWVYTGGESIDLYSEGLVMGRLYQQEHAPSSNPNGFLIQYGKDYENDFWYVEDQYLQDAMQDPQPYLHGCGFQGTLYAAFDTVLRAVSVPVRFRLLLYRLTAGSLFWLTLILLARWLHQEFGSLGAGLVLFACALCPFAQKGAFNIYWQFWTLLAPMLASIFVCKKYRNGVLSWPGLALLTGMLLLRFSFGFEFVSTILISIEIPVLYYGIHAPSKNWYRWRNLFIGLAGIGLLAFILMLLAWIRMESAYWGSFPAAMQDILGTIGKRTGAFSYETDDPRIAESLALSHAKMVWGYMCWQPFTAGQSVLRIIGGYVLVAIVAAAATIRGKRDQLLALFRNWVVLFFAFCAPVSWYVLATGHSLIHMHINHILWFVPFVPLLLAHMGWLLTDLAQKVWSRLGKRTVV